MCGRGLDLATLRWDEARLSIIQPAGTVRLHLSDDCESSLFFFLYKQTTDGQFGHKPIGASRRNCVNPATATRTKKSNMCVVCLSMLVPQYEFVS
jgi:hypothetical protein